MSEPSAHTLGQTASPSTGGRGKTSAAQLILLFECERLAASSMAVSLFECEELLVGRASARVLVREDKRARLELPDRWLSSKHASFQNSFGRWILHDCESKNGTRVNGQPCRRRELQDGDLIELGRSFFLFRDEVALESICEGNFEREEAPATLNAALSQELAKLSKLAETDISILLLGDSGAGKEVIAKRLHEASKRSGAFVPVNCGALPEGLVESELFGHKKGAFSGAIDDHKGLVRSADHGTLFLDEIADLPSSSQATLLRVLQEKEVRAVGATNSHSVDVRTIAATHLDLDVMVESGEFRRDLFARIAGYRYSLPSLRERLEDIGLLIAAFVHGTSIVAIDIDAARALLAYHWPLNIRELRSSLATATVLAEGDRLELSHLPEPLRATPKRDGTDGSLAATDRDRRARLLALLADHQGNISAVARAMGKDRKQIQRWLKRYEIDIDRYRG